MFRCTVCKKLHSRSVEYCDCGNDMFEEVSESETLSSLQPKLTVTPQQILSGAIFAACLAASGWIWFGLNPQKTITPSEKPKQEIQNEVKNIPQIDDIWNDALPDTVMETHNPVSVYKSELQKALYSNLENIDVIEEGRCRIEFRINKNGKLTNRRLIKETGGNLFNNTVIKMMRKTSKVDAPPNGYAGIQFTADVFTENGVIKIKLR